MLFDRNAAAPIEKPHDPRMRLGDRCQHCRAATVLAEAVAVAACRPYSSNEESAARYLHVFGLDQLDLLGDRARADRFWFQSPRYLRAMALLENTQKAGRGDPGIDTAPPNRNRAPKQSECRRGFKVSLAPIERWPRPKPRMERLVGNAAGCHRVRGIGSR